MMNTMIRTSLLCDAVPFPDSTRVRRRSAASLPDPSLEPQTTGGTLSTAMAGGSPAVHLGTFTVIGSQVKTTVLDGQLVVSFYLNCSRSRRVEYPASRVVQTRTIGECDGHALVELTIAYWRAGR